MSFYLVRLDPDPKTQAMVETAMPDYGPYNTGVEAARLAKEMTATLGVKVQPRRISQAPDWRARQAKRLADGTLKPLPKEWDLEPIPDHFAHLSSRDQTKIAFTESEPNGAIDRATAVTPGRYLTRFYPDVDDAKRRQMIALIDNTEGILFATTPEEIKAVYLEGRSVGSCMNNPAYNWTELYRHPVEAYGAGDLAVAYMLSKSKTIQSRAVCWPEKKQYGRTYGDEARIGRVLDDAGWEQVDNFVGARLLKIPNPDNPGQYIAPYFDNIEYGADHGEFFITTTVIVREKPFICSPGTDGVTWLLRRCPKMEMDYRADQFVHVHGAEQEWSSSAIAHYGFTCPITEKVWDRTFGQKIHSGAYWSKEAIASHAFQCDHTKQWFRLDEQVVLPDGRKVSQYGKRMLEAEQAWEAKRRPVRSAA